MKTVLIAFVAVASLAGCGSDTFHCCYNKLFYDCANQDTLNQCAAGAVAQCTRDATKDGDCTTL